MPSVPPLKQLLQEALGKQMDIFGAQWVATVEAPVMAQIKGSFAQTRIQMADAMATAAQAVIDQILEADYLGPGSTALRVKRGRTMVEGDDCDESTNETTVDEATSQSPQISTHTAFFNSTVASQPPAKKIKVQTIGDASSKWGLLISGKRGRGRPRGSGKKGRTQLVKYPAGVGKYREHMKEEADAADGTGHDDVGADEGDVEA
ncbi:hypothetical protein HK101_005496 [Irineochytrium annulatum]|nr:hypothetical protein HK101_005496 [Irineochytrium annulatum]